MNQLNKITTLMTQKVLFVDDEVNVLQGFQRRFRNKLALDIAVSGEDGLKMLESKGPYAVVVSDMQMPGMNGLEFLIRVKNADPNTIRIMLTGNADKKTAVDAVNEGQIFRFLSKPCSNETLSTALHASLEEYRHNSALKGALKDVQYLSARLSYQEIHDQLTHLINRQEFEKCIQKILESLNAKSEDYTLVHLNLDQFKIVNDGCGKVAGNELLRQITHLLKIHIRRHDTLARIGGDEFGILLEYCSIAEALQIAEGIRKDISDHVFKWDKKSFRVSTSIGLAQLNNEVINAEKMLSHAESACILAKNRGRNRTHVFRRDDKDLVRLQSELQWVSRINQALVENRFFLAFQPIVPISEQVSGKHYEILLRLQDEDGTIIPPGAFLPAAERYNLSAKLDQWVINTTFHWLIDHPRHLDELQLCSINLSGLSLGNQEFLDFIISEFRKTKVPPEKICFEITETAAITDLPNAMKIIDRLKNMGCYFALDDFGSGLSSYAYLKNLRVDFLKIDGLFVKGIVDSEIDFVMVKSITEIGHVMGIQTVAEFVENQAILSKLKEIGVDFAQGHGIAKPRPIEELIEMTSKELA